MSNSITHHSRHQRLFLKSVANPDGSSHITSFPRADAAIAQINCLLISNDPRPEDITAQLPLEPNLQTQHSRNMTRPSVHPEFHAIFVIGALINDSSFICHCCTFLPTTTINSAPTGFYQLNQELFTYQSATIGEVGTHFLRFHSF